jgi:hypothetical protein
MKGVYFWLCVFCLLIITSCEKVKIDPTQGNSGQQVYFNSFESESSTAGWIGYAFSFKDDAPEKGGKKSLCISGGCILPHAEFEISPQPFDCHLVLTCWGKCLDNGGGVSLYVNQKGYGGTNISISEKKWAFYTSPDILFCPANTSMTLSMMAGGIVSGSILVDMIEIKKINVHP